MTNNADNIIDVLYRRKLLTWIRFCVGQLKGAESDLLIKRGFLEVHHLLYDIVDAPLPLPLFLTEDNSHYADIGIA